jgi:hypothetical protein
MVRDGLVESQAAILPTRSINSTTAIVDVVEGIGRNLGLAIANAGATPATVELTLRDENGGVSATATLSIAARHQIARFLTELFPGDVMGAAFRGSLLLESSVPVHAVGLRFSGAEFSSLPIAATADSDGPVVFPQFAMSGGWATTLGLVNTTAISIAGRVEFFDSNGNRMAVRLNGELKDTFNYSIPPFGSMLLAPRDSNGQSPF